MDNELWFRRLIDAVRLAEQEFSAEDMAHVRGMRLLGFDAPCQVRAFHIVEPQAFFTLVLSIPGGPDRDVRVTRPLRLYEFPAELEKVAEEPLWNAPLPNPEDAVLQPGEEPTFRSAVHQSLIHAYHHAQRLPFQRSYPNPHWEGSGSAVGGSGAAWWYTGNLTTLDPNKIASDVARNLRHEIEAYKQRVAEAATRAPPVPQAPQSTRPAPPGYDGWGVWLYPHLRIGPFPKGSMWDRMMIGRFDLHQMPIATQVPLKNGASLFATYDGFVGVHRPLAEQSKEFRTQAAEYLNALSYALLELEYQSFVVLDDEFVGFEIAKHETGARVSLRSMPYTYRTTSTPLEEIFPHDIQHIGLEQFAEAARFADGIIEHSRGDHARLIVEAATHLRRGHPTESFFFSWLVVEQLVDEDWKAYLHDHKLSDRRLQRMTDTNRWTADTKLEILDLASALGLDYTAAMSIKNPRNEVLHGARKATREEAERALKLARDTFRARLPLDVPKNA